MTITDARSTLTDALNRQSERVNENAQRIARVGTDINTERAAPPRGTDNVQISSEARAAQEIERAEAPEVRTERLVQQSAASDVQVAEENIAAVLVDNIQAEAAFRAAAETLRTVNDLEGSLLERLENRQV